MPHTLHSTGAGACQGRTARKSAAFPHQDEWTGFGSTGRWRNLKAHRVWVELCATVREELPDGVKEKLEDDADDMYIR